MPNEQSNKTDTGGTQTDTSVENPDKPLTPAETLQNLKDSNDQIEKELIRKESLRAQVAASKELGGVGESSAGPAEQTPEQIQAERVNEIGLKMGAKWAKPKPTA